jgi:hypothetical protein
MGIPVNLCGNLDDALESHQAASEEWREARV